MDYHNNYSKVIIVDNEPKEVYVRPGVHLDVRDQSIWVVESIEDFGNPHPLLFNLALTNGVQLTTGDTLDLYGTRGGKKVKLGTRLVAIRIRNLDNTVNRVITFKTYVTFLKELT